MTIEKKITAMEADSKMKIQFVRNPIKQKSDNWHDTAHEWLITFPTGATTRYYTGMGHREAKAMIYDRRTYSDLKHKNLTESGFEKLLEASKPTKPTLKDVLYSLQSDAQAANQNFSDWCSDMGLNDDSMKDMETYKQCVATAGLLRGLGFNLDDLAEFYQDY